MTHRDTGHHEPHAEDALSHEPQAFARLGLSEHALAAVRRELPEYQHRLDGFCRPETVGAVTVVGGRIRSADLFGDPNLFARLWDKISAATWAGSAGCDERDRWAPDAAAVRRFLRDAAFASYRERGTPGVGRLYAVGGAAEGSALVWDWAVVHLSLFPGAAVHPPEPIPMPRR